MVCVLVCEFSVISKHAIVIDGEGTMFKDQCTIILCSSSVAVLFILFTQPNNRPLNTNYEKLITDRCSLNTSSYINTPLSPLAPQTPS
jgi:hypothetical protein